MSLKLKDSTATGLSEDSISVTTAEVASMSTLELRIAVATSRQVEAVLREMKLTTDMNISLQAENTRLQQQIEDLTVKPLHGVEQRMVDNQIDDELPKLRMENEALLTRKLVLEAQLVEAARYYDLLSSDMSKKSIELQHYKDTVVQLNQQNSRLIEDKEELNLQIESMKKENSFTPRSVSPSTVSPSQIKVLEATLAEVTEKSAKRKAEILSLRSSINYLKSKLNESHSIRSTDSALIDSTALDQLHQSFESKIISFRNSTAFIDSLFQRVKNLQDQALSSSEFSLFDYFHSILFQLKKSNTSYSQAGGVSVTELNSQSDTIDGLPNNFIQYETGFVLLSLALIQQLSEKDSDLQKKTHEYEDLLEDFAEFKRKSTSTVSRNTGPRKLSTETQQVAIQKKSKELELKNHELEKSLHEAIRRIDSDAQEFETEKSKLLVEKNHLESELELSRSELLKLKDIHDNQVIAFQQLLEDHQKLKAAHEQSSKDSRTMLQQTSEALSQITKELASSTLLVQSLQIDISSKTSLIQDLESQIGQKDKYIIEMKELLQSTSTTLESTIQERVSLQSENSSLQKLLEDYLKEIENLKSTNLSHIETHSQSVKYIDELSSKLDKSLESYTSLSEKFDILQTDYLEQQKTLEITRSSLTHDLNSCKEENLQLKSDQQLSIANAQRLETTLHSTQSLLESLQKSYTSLENVISEREAELEAHKYQISQLQKSILALEEAEIAIKDSYIKEQSKVEDLTKTINENEITCSNQLSQINQFSHQIELLQTHQKQLELRIEAYKSELEKLQVEFQEKSTQCSNLENLLSTTQEKNQQSTSQLQDVISDLKTKIELSKENVNNLQTQLNELQILNSEHSTQITKHLSEIQNLTEQNQKLSSELETMKEKEIKLIIKSQELDLYMKKLPEIQDESLDASERAISKLFEYIMNKEKSTNSTNSLAAQIIMNSNTGSPSHFGVKSVRQQIQLNTQCRSPAFIASIINIVKKDSYSDYLISKYEEIFGSGTEVEILSSLDDCLKMARTVGVRTLFVTPQQLYQGNRRSIVDFCLDIIRIYVTSKISLSRHPELCFLFAGKEEEQPTPESIILEWVNYWIENWNELYSNVPVGYSTNVPEVNLMEVPKMTLTLPKPSTSTVQLIPARPKISNLGRDLSDGRVLGIVMAGINPEWKTLAEPNAVDHANKIASTLQQTSFMRNLPPFLDSPVPIWRGDEQILIILLSTLLEWNSGLNSELVNSVHTKSLTSNASLLASSAGSSIVPTTGNTSGARAVSGSAIFSTPAKSIPHVNNQTPVTTHSTKGTPVAARLQLLSDPKPNTNLEPQIKIKTVEGQSGWSSWFGRK